MDLTDSTFRALTFDAVGETYESRIHKNLGLKKSQPFFGVLMGFGLYWVFRFFI